jgi:hypothetical protein
MKNVLLFAVLLISSAVYGQSGSLRIINNTGQTYNVTVWAEAPTNMGTTTCIEINTIINIPAGATWFWANPRNFEISTTYCGSGCTPWGWNFFPTGFSGTVCGVGCPTPVNSWAGIYPSDWEWTYAFVDPFMGCSSSCCVSGPIGNCGYSSSITAGCGTSSASWTASGVSPKNIVITIN